MREYVTYVSTEVFRLVQHQAPGYVSWGEEKPGPTQKILVREDVYAEFIDRAIAHGQTLDQVIREACTRTPNQIFSGGGPGGNARRMENAHIALVQRHSGFMSFLSRRLQFEHPNNPNEIDYFYVPEDVLEPARKSPFDVMLSGVVLDSKKYGGRNVGMFARDLKQINPEILFLVYSIYSPNREECSYIDGIIQKGRAETFFGVIGLMADSEIGDISRRRNYALLAKKFPFIDLVRS
jgi:hypothetical protein